jgi:ubiquinone/menaquinone biosynthesis C-methylase UbiE
MESTHNLAKPPAAGAPGGPDRRHLAAMWAAVARSWDKHADYVDERAQAVTDAMLAATAPAAGERVLELACGPGGVGLAAAEIVGPTGYVILSDVVAEMTAIAAARIRQRRIANASTKLLDLMDIGEPDSGYDVVLCREGLMFAPDPARAVREIARVLKPGGRAGIAVWGPQQANPWLGVVFEAVTAQSGMPIPPPGIPGPFSLGDNIRLHQLFADAGFAGITVSEVPAPMRTASFDDWWTRTLALAGPLSRILAELPPKAVDALRARLETATEPYRTNSGLELPGISLLVSARKAN